MTAILIGTLIIGLGAGIHLSFYLRKKQAAKQLVPTATKAKRSKRKR